MENAEKSVPCDAAACTAETIDKELETVFEIVKTATGHDFSSYKRNTVIRRMERRMAVNEIKGIDSYVALLRKNAQEAQAFSQEILIGVTSFFRDPEAFALLRDVVVPRLFTDRSPDEPVRIWHPCCATGEEAYSMAFLIREYLDEHKIEAKVQIFATDLDETAISQARQGLYTDEIETAVGEERLRAFFRRTEDRWQVGKRVREMIVFAHHSLIKNPPFSRLDLLVCRNFLIYLNAEMQKRLLSLFHQVLNPGGILFLGSSETVGRSSDLFTPVSKKWKIFERTGSGHRTSSAFPFTAPLHFPRGAFRTRQTAEGFEPNPGAVAERRLLERYSPPCVIVNEKYELIHIPSRTSRFLEIPVGQPTSDLLKMAREELRPALRAAIHKAFSQKTQVVFSGVKVAGDNWESSVNVVVEPLPQSSGPDLAMVVFEPAPATASLCTRETEERDCGDQASGEILMGQLEEQLRITHEELQATVQQLEATREGLFSANEELISMNEEYQSANEELQSTNEELETSKEELQSLNEELVTVNAELQEKVEELNQANSDMENLLASSQIATIFLDREFTIKRFSPAMAGIFNLIPADVGRPFRHLAGTVDWSDLPGDAQTVLDRLVPIEREVTALEDGRQYLMRVLPYRTTIGNIDGIVVNLIDMTEYKRLQERTIHLASFPQLNPNPVLEIDFLGKITFFNPATETILATLGMKENGPSAFLPADLNDIISDWDGLKEADIYREVAFGGKVFGESIFLTPQFEVVRIYAYDITRRKLAEEALLRSKEEWERTFDSVPDLIAIMDIEHRVTRVNKAMARRLGTPAEACIGQHCFRAVHGSDQPPAFCPHSRTMKDSAHHEAELTEDRLGGDFFVTTTPLLDEQGRLAGSVHVARDITERRKAEADIRKSMEELTRFNKVSVGRELRMIELKKEVNELLIRAGEQARYPLDFEEE